jgi:hypothetical protein
LVSRGGRRFGIRWQDQRGLAETWGWFLKDGGILGIGDEEQAAEADLQGLENLHHGPEPQLRYGAEDTIVDAVLGAALWRDAARRPHEGFDQVVHSLQLTSQEALPEGAEKRGVLCDPRQVLQKSFQVLKGEFHLFDVARDLNKLVVDEEFSLAFGSGEGLTEDPIAVAVQKELDKVSDGEGKLHAMGEYRY